MEALLGLSVLTGPSWLIFILLPVSIWIAVKATKRFKHIIVRVASGLGIFLFVLLVPFADEALGKMYFNHLCASEFERKVYKTIELPAKYWDEYGNPKFLNTRGVLVREVLGNRFEWRRVDEPSINWIIKIDKRSRVLQDNKFKQDLGEKITFIRHYGWLNQFSTAPNVSESCRDLLAERYDKKTFSHKENSDEIEFMLEIFHQSDNKNNTL